MTGQTPPSGNRNGFSLLGKIFTGLVASYGLLFVVCLWNDKLDEDWFWKLTLTYGAVAAVLGGGYLIRREFESDRKMRDDNYMD